VIRSSPSSVEASWRSECRPDKVTEGFMQSLSDRPLYLDILLVRNDHIPMNHTPLQGRLEAGCSESVDPPFLVLSWGTASRICK
jgi:hypothetical protein